MHTKTMKIIYEVIQLDMCFYKKFHKGRVFQFRLQRPIQNAAMGKKYFLNYKFVQRRFNFVLSQLSNAWRTFI